MVPSNKSIPAALFTFLCLALPAIVLAPPPPQLLVMDLPEFYTAARMMASGLGSKIYNANLLMNAEQAIFGANHGVVLYIPPLSSWLLLPLAYLPLSAAAPVWLAFLLLAVVASVLLLSKSMCLSSRQITWTTVILCLSGPEWESLRHGQLSPVLLLSLSAASFLLKEERVFLAACFLSLLLLKPQIMLPVAVILFAAGRFRLLAYLSTMVGAYGLVSWLVVGQEGYASYSALMKYSLDHRQWMVPEACPTIRGQLLRFMPTSDQLVVFLSTGALLVALALVFLLVFFKLRRRSDWFELGLLGGLPLSLFASLHTHNYDLLVLLPAFLKLQQLNCLSLKTPATWLLLAATAAFMLPLYTFLHYGFVLHGSLINPLFIAMAILAIVCFVVAWRQGAQPAPQETFDLPTTDTL